MGYKWGDEWGKSRVDLKMDQVMKMLNRAVTGKHRLRRGKMKGMTYDPIKDKWTIK